MRMRKKGGGERKGAEEVVRSSKKKEKRGEKEREGIKKQGKRIKGWGGGD